MRSETQVVLTKHAIKRAHQRLGVGRHAAARTAEKAWFCGRKIDSSCMPDRWTLGNMPAKDSGRIAKKYGQFYYLFQMEDGPPVFLTVLYGNPSRRHQNNCRGIEA